MKLTDIIPDCNPNIRMKEVFDVSVQETRYVIPPQAYLKITYIIDPANPLATLNHLVDMALHSAFICQEYEVPVVTSINVLESDEHAVLWINALVNGKGKECHGEMALHSAYIVQEKELP